MKISVFMAISSLILAPASFARTPIVPATTPEACVEPLLLNLLKKRVDYMNRHISPSRTMIITEAPSISFAHPKIQDSNLFRFKINFPDRIYAPDSLGHDCLGFVVTHVTPSQEVPKTFTCTVDESTARFIDLTVSENRIFKFFNRPNSHLLFKASKK